MKLFPRTAESKRATEAPERKLALPAHHYATIGESPYAANGEIAIGDLPSIYADLITTALESGKIQLTEANIRLDVLSNMVREGDAAGLNETVWMFADSLATQQINQDQTEPN